MASIATPSAQGFDFSIFMPFINWAKPYVIGAVGGIASTLIPGFTQEFFRERNRKHRHKIEVAREVHKLCIEASTHSFRKPARNQEHVMSVLTDVEGIDRRRGEDLNRFITLWSLLSIELQKDKARERKEEYDHLMDMLHEIEEKRKTLEGWANRIRAGGKPR